MATIDIAEDLPTRPWHPTEWIGVNKKYPADDTPPIVIATRQELLRIPPPFQSYIPDPHLSILDLLKSDLPSQSSALVLQNARDAFSFLDPDPDANLSCLATRPIPSLAWLQKLEAEFGQAWFNGARSIVDPRYKQSRLPFWVLNLWKEMSDVNRKKSLWQASEEWLTKHTTNNTKDGEVARGLLASLSWGTKITALGASTGLETLTRLLSDRWLDDEIVNMLLYDMNRRTRLYPDTSHIMIAPVWAYEALKDGYKRKDYGKGSVALLHHYKEEVERGKSILHVPGNKNSNHWVNFRVDFDGKIFSYGDSLVKKSNRLDARKPEQEKNWLQGWFKKEFGGKAFHDDGYTLNTGVQKDTFSCGICVVNAIGHDVFGDKLFTHETRRLLRIQYFVILAKAHNDMISKTTSCENDNLGGEVTDTFHLASWFLDPLNKATETETVGPDASHVKDTDLDPSPPVMASSSQDVSVDISQLEHVPILGPSFCPVTDGTLGTIPDAPGVELEDMSVDDDAVLEVPPKDVPPTTKDDGAQKRPHSPETEPQINNDRSKRSRLSGSNQRTMFNFVSSSKVGELTAAPPKVNHPSLHQRLSVTVIGTSRSAKASRKLKASMADGTFVPSAAKVENYKTEIRINDKDAEFRFGSVWEVFHSRCGKWMTMSEAYNTAKFKVHLKTCKGSGKVSTMDSWAKQLGWGKPSHVAEGSRLRVKSAVAVDPRKIETAEWEPCMGITASSDPRVSTYLQRTGAKGGGGRAPYVIARERWGCGFDDLTQKQKDIVYAQQEQEHTWRNDHTNRRVYAVSCQKRVSLDIATKGLCCSECQIVLDSKAFKDLMRVPIPQGTDWKHLNKRYQNKALAQLYARTVGLQDLIEDETAKDSICVRYALGVLNGKFKDRAVFTGLVEAMVKSQEREASGKGMQNFQYAPDLDEFSIFCATVSPEVYRFMGQHFQLRSHRSIQIKRARMPRFPTVLGDRTFDIAADYLKSRNYRGPVAHACDDTKLHASLRTYWDPETKMNYLVGHTDEPIPVANVEELEKLLRQYQSNKATKLRLWCIQIPLPKISPLIIGAKAIPNTMTTTELHRYATFFITGLIKRGVMVVSYACDGTELERGLQNNLIDTATYCAQYVVEHPCKGLPAIDIRIPTFCGQPVAMVQDSKHALKTYRNNLFSGARLLVLGNFVAMYSYAYALAFEANSPLFNRDVVKLDRQDDNGATRLFSATVIIFLVEHHPELVGMIVFIFVFGELVDAYQNRSISHVERLKMAFRARFFLDIWRMFLKKAGYPENRFLISRESVDITRILVNALISLVIIHRDHMGGEVYPLLPWLHSSEMCEHAFAECRKLVKDFTYLDFLYMIPRLTALLRATAKFGHGSDPKARASGYAHTYFESDGIDIALLSVYPTDREIQTAAREGWEEAENLFNLLGVSTTDLLHSESQSKPAAPPRIHLPSIESWFDPGCDPVGVLPGIQQRTVSEALHVSGRAELSFEESDGETDDGMLESEEEDDTVQLQRLIDGEESATGRKTKDNDRMFVLTCAAIAADVDDTMFARQSQDLTPEEEEEHAKVDSIDIAGAVYAARLPALNLPSEAVQPFDRPLSSIRTHDFSSLIAVRRSHETHRAAVGVRTKTHEESVETSDSMQKPLSVRQQITKEMNSILRQYLDQGATTGVGRSIRWTNSVPGGPSNEAGPAVSTPNGNSANAELAAGQRASTIIKRRVKTFSQFQIPATIAKDLADGLVGTTTSDHPKHSVLCAGKFGVVLVNSRLLVGHILALYSQGGGKSGAHAWQQDVKNLGAVSYVVAQLYEPAFHSRFRAIHGSAALLQTYTFTHLGSDFFLQLLPGSHQLSPDRRTLELESHAYVVFCSLQSERVLPKLRNAVDILKKARRKGNSKKGKGGDAMDVDTVASDGE